MNDILRIARLRIALQRAFLGRAILRVIFLVSFIPRNQSNNQPRNQPTIQTICCPYGFRIFDEHKRSGQTIFLTFLGVLNFFLLFSVLVLDEGHCRTE